MMQDCQFENLPQQQIYAKILLWGVRFGLFLFLSTFILYTTGLLPPLIEITTVTEHWHLPLQEYLVQTQSPKGWQWLTYFNQGDYLSFAGIVWLPLLSAICYTYLAITFIQSKDYGFFFIAIAELTLITISAGNLLHLG